MITVDTDAEDTQKKLDALKKAVSYKAIDGLTVAGAFLEKEMVHKIETGLQPPLHPATIKNKGSSKQLQDTGELLSQIAFFTPLDNHDIVEVGIFGSRAKVAKWHEFGKDIDVTPKMRAYLHHIGIHLNPNTDKIHIPERSFLRTALAENEKKVKKIVKGEMKK